MKTLLILLLSASAAFGQSKSFAEMDRRAEASRAYNANLIRDSQYRQDMQKMQRSLDQQTATLNSMSQGSSPEVDVVSMAQYNALVKKYNDLLAIAKPLIDAQREKEEIASSGKTPYQRSVEKCFAAYPMIRQLNHPLNMQYLRIMSGHRSPDDPLLQNPDYPFIIYTQAAEYLNIHPATP